MTTPPFVRLFGGPIVVPSHGPPIEFTPVQACLIALAHLEPSGALTRERIAWYLWEEGEDDKTRHRVRQLLYQLNSRAETPVLERRGDAVFPLLSSDADVVEPGDDPPLARLPTPPTAAFEHWLDSAVRKLRTTRRMRLAAALDDAVQEERWSTSVETCLRLIRLDPDRSQWLPVLIDSAIRAGRKATCLTVIWDLRESGFLSAEEVLGMEATLGNLPRALERRTVHSDDVQLIGRSRECSWIEQRLSLDHGFRVVVVVGNGGVGKTKLMSEVGRRAAAGGLRVAVAPLSERAAAVPLFAARDLLDQALGPDGLERVPEPWRAVLFGALWEGEPLPEVLEPVSASRRLREAFRIGLQVAAEEGHLLLCLDDLQWIDETSIDLLTYVSRVWSDGACTLLANVRPEVGRRITPRVASFLDASRAERLEIEGLSEDHCLQVLNLSGGAGLSDVAKEEIIQLAAGNPLLLLDVARYWEKEHEWTLGTVPQSLRDLARKQWAQLARFERELLSVVVAIPKSPSSVLAAVLGLPSWRVLEGLDVLTSANLIDLNDGRYSFRHSLILEAIQQELGITRTREGHLRVARYLCARHPDSPAEIVHHLRQGGALGEAAEWAVSAAKMARDQGALQDALRFSEIALESPQGATNPTLVAETGRASLLLCQREKGIQLLTRAEALLGGEPRTIWSVEKLDAMSEAGQLGHSECAERLTAIARSAQERLEWGVALGAIEAAIRVLERAGHHRGIAALLQDVRSIGPFAQPETEIRRSMILALGMVYDGEPKGAVCAATRAFSLARTAETSDDLLTRAAHRLFVVLLSEGTVETNIGKECLEVLQRRAHDTGDLKLMYSNLANQAVWYLDTGQLDVAEELLEQAEEVVTGSGASNELQNLATNRGDLLLRQGDPDAALRHFEEAEALIEPGTRGFLRDLSRAGIGLCLLHVGQLQGAQRCYSDLRAYSHYYFDPSLMIKLDVELRWRRQRYSEALERLRTSRNQIQYRFVPQYLGLTLWEARLRIRQKAPGVQQLIEEVRERSRDLGISQVEAQARRTGLLAEA